MKAIEKISQELFDNLKAPYIKNLSMGDADANSTDDAEQARNFAFNFSVGNFTLGTVQVKLNSDKQYLEVQFGHDLLNKVEDQSPEVQQRIKQLWFGFLRKMRKFVNTCPELTFKINNETQDHLNKKDAEMYTVDELKEGKMSKLAGSTKSSYQKVGENRIIIRHVGPIDEEKMGSRTRNIKAIYIENASGERFLVKENSLIGARILAHHMSAGGNLMDDFSNHLYTMIREMRDLKSFVLGSRNKVFESDDANQMVEAATEYYKALRETVRSLSTGRGYARYLESFDPKIDETNIDAEALKEKFVIRTFNEKFEAALPHIAKAYQKKILEQNALYGAAQNYIDGETKFGLTESDVELYKSMKFESGQALSKKVLEHIATLLQSTDSRLSEFAAQSAEKFSTITEAPESQTWLHQDLAMNLVKGFVAEMNNLSEKPINPYAIGMAQAMKSTGDEPPLKKSTIKKAHHIADKIADSEQGVAEGSDNKELYGLKLGDVVKARVDDSIVQGNVIDLFPETMEVELLLRGDMAGRTVTVDVRDTEYMDESGVAEGSSDISGLMAVSHLNKSFIITAETAEGQTKRFRVNAQSERVAKEKFEKHHSIAKIVSIKEEGVAEGYQDDSKEREENLRYARSRNPVADKIRKKLNPNQKPEKEQGVAEAQQVEEMDKSQTPPGRDGGEQFPPGPKVSKKDIKAMQKDPAKALSDLFAKQYAKKKIKEQGVAEGGVLKSIKRGMQGWGRDELPITGTANKPKDVVARTKSYDIDTAKMLRKGLDDAPEHTPAGLQKRVLDRKLKGVAEGAPELLKKEMPTHRHAEKLLAQKGVSKDDPDYHHHLNNTIKHLRQFGNINLINKSDEEGVAEGSLNEISKETAASYFDKSLDKSIAMTDQRKAAKKAGDVNTVKSLDSKFKKMKSGMTGALKRMQGVAEERKETKNEKGEVTSWSDETPWHKAKPKKQPSGTAANLAGQALQQTKKMADKEEPNMTESKATTDNKVFTDTLAMLKKYSGI